MDHLNNYREATNESGGQDNFPPLQQQQGDLGLCKKEVRVRY